MKINLVGLCNYNHTEDNSLVIYKNIEFEIEIQDSFSIDGAVLDFGNLVRGDQNTTIAKDNLQLKTTYEEDMFVRLEYEEMEESIDEGYSKFKIYPYLVEEKEEIDRTIDFLEVYIKNIEDYVLKKGEYEIPIIGEIRKVGKNIKLGKYQKSLKVNVIMNSISK